MVKREVMISLATLTVLLGAVAPSALAVPQEPIRFDGSGFEAADRKVGDAGLVLGETPDALCLAADMFEFGTFTVVAMTEPELFDQLLRWFHTMIMDRLDAMLGAGPVRFVRARNAGSFGQLFNSLVDGLLGRAGRNRRL